MSTTRTVVVAVLVVLALLALGVVATAGAHVTAFGDEPVTSAGHVADQWGWHNDWGDHRHGDGWSQHDRHAAAGDDTVGPDRPGTPHTDHHDHSSPSPHRSETPHTAHGPGEPHDGDARHDRDHGGQGTPGPHRTDTPHNGTHGPHH